MWKRPSAHLWLLLQSLQIHLCCRGQTKSMQAFLLGNIPNTCQANEAGHMASRTQVSIQVGRPSIEDVLAAGKVVARPCKSSYLCNLTAACTSNQAAYTDFLTAGRWPVHLWSWCDYKLVHVPLNHTTTYAAPKCSQLGSEQWVTQAAQVQYTAIVQCTT